MSKDFLAGVNERLSATLGVDDLLSLHQTMQDGSYPGLTTAIYFHPTWQILCGHALMHAIHKLTAPTFSRATSDISPLLLPSYLKFVNEHHDTLDAMVDHSRDFQYTGIAVHTFIDVYAARIFTQEKSLNKLILHVKERPQYMWLRCAVYMWHGLDAPIDQVMAKIKQVYTDLSTHQYIHATPTLINSGMKVPQLSSCFLMVIEDSLQSLTKVWGQMSFISKYSGGVGVDLSALRHSEIGLSGMSGGIVPWIKIMNEIFKAVNQQGRRKGNVTFYLDVSHIDIEDFLDLRKNSGSEDMRARESTYAVMIPDIFMERVRDDGMWSLFCPNIIKRKNPKQSPRYTENLSLYELWGADYAVSYQYYESKEMYHRRVRARDLWVKILTAQIETGVPFIIFKDSVNRKTNQQNLGTIRCSNLCTEIMEYTSPDEVAVCTLASISLPACVDVHSSSQSTFNTEKLRHLTGTLVENLDRVIDINAYLAEVPEMRANLKHRPMGIGVQGLADVFALLGISWNSDAAKQLNQVIFENIYYAALSKSCELARKYGPYSSFKGSPGSKGVLQFDMWNEETLIKTGKSAIGQTTIPESEWKILRQDISTHGLRNSLLVALMPTSTTSIMLDNTECIEPITSNLFTRQTLAGRFLQPNKHLVSELERLGLWSDDMADKIRLTNGSIQSISGIPVDVKQRYLGVYELSQRRLLELNLDRSRYICQSVSFNVHIRDPDLNKLNAYHMVAWEGGAKTSSYYIRQPPAVDPNSFKQVVCSGDTCTSCSS